MRKIIIFVAALVLAAFININFQGSCHAEVLTGNVNKEEFLERSNVVVDGTTGDPIAGAEVSIPTEGIFTKTNGAGQFKLDAFLQGPAILSVKASGYKPFSITIDESGISNPLVISVTKLAGNEIVIDNKIRHLGDNKFSMSSANSRDFNVKAEGSYFFKDFFVKDIDISENAVLKLGSVIGLDTQIAKRLGQSKTTISTSTPMSIFLNSEKIGEIKVNGDNQEIPLPKNLLRPNSYNTLRIETGINQETTKYVDYDDMEFMNLMLVIN